MRSSTSPALWDYTIMYRSITSPAGLHHHVPIHHQPGGTTPSCSGPSPAQWDHIIMFRSTTSPAGLHHHVQVHHQPGGTTPSCSGPSPAQWDYTIMYRSTVIQSTEECVALPLCTSGSVHPSSGFPLSLCSDQMFLQHVQ